MDAPRTVAIPERKRRTQTPRATGYRSSPTTRKSRRVLIAVLKPNVTFEPTPFEQWAEKFENRHYGGYLTNHPNLMEVEVPTVIKIPKRTREGSVTDEQVTEVHAAIAALNKGEAVVVCTGMDAENSARNRARSLAQRHEEMFATVPDPSDPTKTVENTTDRYLTAIAVPDPDADGKWIGAVHLRPQQKPHATPKRKPKPAAKPAAKNAPAQG